MSTNDETSKSFNQPTTKKRERKAREPRANRLRKRRFPRAVPGTFDYAIAEQARWDLQTELIWDYGLRMLCADGSDDASARAFLGKRASELGRESLARAIFESVMACTIDPRAYVAACKREFAPKARASREQPDRQRRRDPADDPWFSIRQDWWDDDDT